MPQVLTLRINDDARFPWRGILLDTARHFIPVEAGSLGLKDILEPLRAMASKPRSDGLQPKSDSSQLRQDCFLQVRSLALKELLEAL